MIRANGHLGETRVYDQELQMFCEATRDPQPSSLQFLRWLAEQGKLEHTTYGPPIGQYAESCEDHDPFELALVR